jgi:hypothetical protein
MTMILMKIDDKGELLADWDEIESLAKSFDRGCGCENSYKAKLISLIWKDGYERATTDMVSQHNQMALLLSCTGGSA